LSPFRKLLLSGDAQPAAEHLSFLSEIHVSKAFLWSDFSNKYGF
jgi:hypothetical protein